MAVLFYLGSSKASEMICYNGKKGVIRVKCVSPPLINMLRYMIFLVCLASARAETYCANASFIKSAISTLRPVFALSRAASTMAML